MPIQVFTTLDAPSATLSGTSANGISASGAIVGHYQVSATVTNGFLLSGGTYTILTDPLATQHDTLAFGINASGQIVGTFTDDNGDHGFLLSGGFSITLDDPLATNGTQPEGINDLGQVVGTYTNASGIHGFLYNPSGGGTYTTLDDPQRASTTQARSSAGTRTRTTLFTPFSTAAAPSPPSTFRGPPRVARLPMASTIWARS